MLRHARITCYLLILQFVQGGISHLQFAQVFAQAPAQQPAATQQQHPLVPAIQLAQQSLQVVQKVNDYSCTVVKRELINNQLVSQRIAMKLREAPFSVYMKFEQPHAGREVLYVHGQNQNQLLVHEAEGLATLAGTLSLAVNSPQVTAENRHPVTDVGMRRMLDLVIAQWTVETQFGEIDVKFYPDAKLREVPCEVIESSHPRPRKQFPFHMTRLFLEKQTRLPIRIENYGFPAQANQAAPLVEEYTYLNVQANIGLTAADFDQANRKYNFK